MSEAKDLINRMLKTKRDFEAKHGVLPKQIEITADEFEQLKKLATVHVNYKGDPINTFYGVRIVIKEAA